uniref:Uncharacterized protein n=1 Tax=Anguilla anguilla TaxID=7936 RepID=A0A0E9TI56_ANGAN
MSSITQMKLCVYRHRGC